LFAEKKWKEEQEAEERAWQQHLQNIADARAEARSEVDFQRRIALATREETLALQREGRNKQFDATQRDLDRRARRDEFGMRMSAEERARHDDIAMKRREMLQDTLTRIEERYEDQRSNTMINLDADKMAALETQYKEDRDRAIGSYVQSMMMRAQEYPEVDSYSDFRINSRDEIAGLLESEGATYKGADKIADRWMKWMSDPGADEAGAGGGGFKPTGNYQYTDTDGTVVTGPNYSGRKAPGYDTTPPPPTGGAAQVDPTPRTPMPEAGPRIRTALRSTRRIVNRSAISCSTGCSNRHRMANEHTR
jgi:hypothetical protein